MAQNARARRKDPPRGLAPASTPRKTAPRCPSLSLVTILARFSDALFLLTVAHTALSGKQLTGTGDEAIAIRYALDSLKDIYADLDRPKDPHLA